MFYPAAGVPEDPATGSAAGPLAVHLARHGRISYGDQIQIRQGEEIGRPSVLYAKASGAGDRIDIVEVGGAAVIVAAGHYRTTPGQPGQHRATPAVREPDLRPRPDRFSAGRLLP
jgi:PhzF family phenazine biosynthesis protein